MAKQPTKALNGGNSAFQQDGSWVLEVCQALRQTRKDYESAQSKLVQATEDRDAWTKELAEMGDEPTKAQMQRCAELVKTEQKIKELRDRIKSLAGSYGKIIKKADEGGFEAGMTAKQLSKAALEEEDEDDDGGQMKLGGGKAGGGKGGAQVGPDADWFDQFNMDPRTFRDMEWPMVKEHFDKLRGLQLGRGVKVDNPAALAGYMLKQFNFLKDTGDRKNIMPKLPGWFLEGLMVLMAQHVAGIHNQGDEGREVLSATMIGQLTDAAQIDVDAWLAICGGKDSELNKAILKAKAA